MAKIIVFKTKHQLEMEQAARVMREWEKANRRYLVDREVEEQKLSQKEIAWLNDWLKKKE